MYPPSLEAVIKSHHISDNCKKSLRMYQDTGSLAPPVPEAPVQPATDDEEEEEDEACDECGRPVKTPCNSCLVRQKASQ